MTLPRVGRTARIRFLTGLGVMFDASQTFHATVPLKVQNDLAAVSPGKVVMGSLNPILGKLSRWAWARYSIAPERSPSRLLREQPHLR